ncbi:hypothetical protein GCM10010420_45290 [Streptomyces glaucosporus]|uniref:Uncharacterized protein n=1 Tax=Streptomyces glaucosporus TaxID=284044 RepID=A0ABP5VTB8_9ACTN
MRGGPSAYVPRGAPLDGQGRRGFRTGCTVDGPAGPVRPGLAVRTEPRRRLAGDRLTGADGRALLSTALRAVQVQWRTAGADRTARTALPAGRRRRCGQGPTRSRPAGRRARAAGCGW